MDRTGDSSASAGPHGLLDGRRRVLERRRPPAPLDQRDHVQPVGQLDAVEHLADHGQHRPAGPAGQGEHAADHLAVEALLVEEALAR